MLTIKIKNLRKLAWWKWILVLFMVAVGMIVFNSVSKSSYNNSITSAIKEAKTLKTEEALKEEVIAEINKLYELPTDTEVTIGTITNIEELKSKQKYFEKGKNGDLLLIYPDKTIIYDPVNKIVVDVAGAKLFK